MTNKKSGADYSAPFLYKNYDDYCKSVKVKFYFYNLENVTAPVKIVT